MSTADTDLSTAAPPASVASRASIPSVLATLIRREFWEHRALWMAPLTVAILLVASAFLVRFGLLHLGNDVWPEELNEHHNRVVAFALVQWSLAAPLYLVMLIVLSFYLLDCLYAERKDRSILFWKSLPVSDLATVSSKLLVALGIVPFGVYLLATVSHLLFSGILIGQSVLTGYPAGLSSAWNTHVWLKVEALMLFGVVISILWYAPIAAYFVLVSAWARRNVFLWAILPPIVAEIVERAVFGTNFVQKLIQYRAWGIWAQMSFPHHGPIMTDGDFYADDVLSQMQLPDVTNVGQVFTNIDLWLGVLVAVGLVLAAARIRRYRDDT